jgi:hypothetical protein
MSEQRLYRVPALFWLDHADRSPCDRPEQIADEVCIQNRIALIMANDEQIECLRSDAAFYAGDNVDDCKSIQRSARATLDAIAVGKHDRGCLKRSFKHAMCDCSKATGRGL